MKFSITNFVWLAVIALGAFGLYLVKYSVQEVQRDVAALEQKLAQEKETMQLLQAEWAYVNRPERLREMARGHVASQPVGTATIIDISQLPTRDAYFADADLQHGMVYPAHADMFAPVAAR